MIAYDYDPETGEYIGAAECQENPMEPGTYLIPNHATLTVPPEAVAHTARCFRNGEWIFVTDRRGETIYDVNDSRETATVEALGDIPAGYTLTPPPDAEKWYKFDGETWTEYVPPVTVRDYDNAMEAHLRAERTERGYTTREPDSYLNSSEPRWAQDAADWVAHRDAVMRYALKVQNDYAQGLPVPSLPDFIAALPKIVWTYTGE